MAGPAHRQPDDAYQQWLKALAQAMQSPRDSGPRPDTGSKKQKGAGLLGFDPAEAPPIPPPLKPTEPLVSEKMAFQETFEEPGVVEKNSFLPPRIWDLCKPYVMLILVILLGGIVGIGSLVKLTQWLIPSQRPGVPTAPIEARWEAERRGVHILPDSETSWDTSQPAAPEKELPPAEKQAPAQGP